MKIESKDLYLIDRITMALMSSKLNNTNFILTQDQIENLAVTSYRYATIVHQVRENFKKEHGIIEEEKKENTPYYIFHNISRSCDCEDDCEEDDVDITNVVVTPTEEIQEIQEIQEIEDGDENKDVIVKEEIEDKPKAKRGRPKASRNISENIEKPKRGRKPKATLKVNKILDKRA